MYYIILFIILFSAGAFSEKPGSVPEGEETAENWPIIQDIFEDQELEKEQARSGDLQKENLFSFLTAGAVEHDPLSGLYFSLDMYRAYQKGNTLYSIPPLGKKEHEIYHKELESLKKNLEGGWSNYTRMGDLYRLGLIQLAQNKNRYEMAVHYYKQAVENIEHGYAEYWLGHLYEKGYGVSKNLNEAVNWYERAIRWLDGSNEATEIYYRLGIISENQLKQEKQNTSWGKPVMKSMKNQEKSLLKQRIVFYYTWAGEDGLAMAQVRLAQIYKKGLFNVKPDEDAALKWYSKAVEQSLSSIGPPHHIYGGVLRGNHIALAQFRLTPSKLKKAQFEMARILAQRGQAMAQFALSWMHQNGHGTGKNLNQSQKWYDVANQTFLSLDKKEQEKILLLKKSAGLDPQCRNLF